MVQFENNRRTNVSAVPKLTSKLIVEGWRDPDTGILDGANSLQQQLRSLRFAESTPKQLRGRSWLIVLTWLNNMLAIWQNEPSGRLEFLLSA